MPEARKQGPAGEHHAPDHECDRQEEEENSSQAVATTRGMIESIKKFINKDTRLERLMSMGEAWRHRFNDRVRQAPRGGQRQYVVTEQL